MKSMWAQYSAEILPHITFIEHDYGFISYSMLETAIHLHEIWVTPERRKQGLALKLVEEAEDIGRKAGKTMSLAEIPVISPTCAESLKAHLAVGFKPCMAHDGKIWLERAIVQPEGESK